MPKRCSHGRNTIAGWTCASFAVLNGVPGVGSEHMPFPIVGQIEFLNAERTKAGAAITMGYSGATVVLEKQNGIWRATGLVNQWET